MARYDNNRHEYSIRCTIFSIVMAVIMAAAWAFLYNRYGDESERLEYVMVGTLSVVVFLASQYIKVKWDLHLPDEKAESIDRGALSKFWALCFGCSFGGVFAATLLVSCLINKETPDLLMIVLGCGLFGFVAYFASLPIAFLIAPKVYLPWRTTEGAEAYQKREEERRIKREAQLVYFVQQAQNNSSYTPPSPVSTPAQTSAPTANVRGRVYRAGFSGSEVGYYTNDTIYKSGGIVFDTKVGSYRDGRIDDDAGIWSAHVVGRYEWSNVYSGYLIYAGDSKKEFIGRVCRNGDIQAAKQPHGITEIVLSGVEYTTVGRFTGDPEGAAAAAYLLLFR